MGFSLYKISFQLRGLPAIDERVITRLSGGPHLSYKRDQNIKRNYMIRWVTPLRWLTSPTRSPPSPCKQSPSLGIFT